MNMGIERIRGNLKKKIEYYFPTPALPDCQSVDLLLGDNTWWISKYGEKGEMRFVPREVVEALIIRKDGKPKKQKAFATFISQRFEAIARDYGVAPVGVDRKQKGQLWDENFVRVFLGSLAALETGEITHDKRRSDISYVLRRNVDRAELLAAFLEKL